MSFGCLVCGEGPDAGIRGARGAGQTRLVRSRGHFGVWWKECRPGCWLWPAIVYGKATGPLSVRLPAAVWSQPSCSSLRTAPQSIMGPLGRIPESGFFGWAPECVDRSLCVGMISWLETRRRSASAESRSWSPQFCPTASTLGSRTCVCANLAYRCLWRRSSGVLGGSQTPELSSLDQGAGPRDLWAKAWRPHVPHESARPLVSCFAHLHSEGLGPADL